MTDMSKYIKKSNIKCPICQTLLDVTVMSDKVFGCPKCRNIGNIDLWKELDRWKQSAEDHQNWLRLAENRLDRTRKALNVAKKWLMKIGYLNMSEHGLGSEKMMTDWCKTVALHGLKEIETALEQKD